MFKINRKIEYALISLKHMTSKKPDELTSAKEICEAYHTPFDPTSRVLQIMTQQNILQAEQGARGGYKIIKDLSQVSMLELTDMIIGPIKIANCFHTIINPCEVSGSCEIIAPMLNLNESIRESFKTIQVSSLLKSKHQSEHSIRARLTSTTAETGV